MIANGTSCKELGSFRFFAISRNGLTITRYAAILQGMQVKDDHIKGEQKSWRVPPAIFDAWLSFNKESGYSVSLSKAWSMISWMILPEQWRKAAIRIFNNFVATGGLDLEEVPTVSLGLSDGEQALLDSYRKLSPQKQCQALVDLQDQADRAISKPDARKKQA